MTRIGQASRFAVLSAASVLAVSVAACSSTQEASKAGTFYGDKLDVGNGKVFTFVTTDESGTPTEVGYIFDAGVLDGLPAPMPMPDGPPNMMPSTPLKFPAEAKGVAFDHATFDFNPSGHPPVGVFDKPHFDLHMYMMSADDVKAIDPGDAEFAAKASHLPDAQYVPADFALLPGAPGEPPAIPQMGAHLVDMTQPLIPGQYNFTETLINGSWDGKYSFIEPMITRDYLLSKPAVTHDLKLPQSYQKSALYPTKWGISYDKATKNYKVSLTGLTERTAS